MALPRGLVALGEVGLAGEIRAVPGVGRRLAEAARRGFRRAIVPASSVDDRVPPQGMHVLGASDLAHAVQLVGAVGSPAAAGQSV